MRVQSMNEYIHISPSIISVARAMIVIADSGIYSFSHWAIMTGSMAMIGRIKMNAIVGSICGHSLISPWSLMGFITEKHVQKTKGNVYRSAVGPNQILERICWASNESPKLMTTRRRIWDETLINIVYFDLNLKAIQSHVDLLEFALYEYWL